MNEHEKRVMWSALKMLYDNCYDEIHEKEGIPGEAAAVRDDQETIEHCINLQKRFDLDPLE